MPRQFNVYNGTVFGSDSAATKNTVVERDGNAATWVAGANASDYTATEGLYVGGATISTSTTIATSPTTAPAFNLCDATSGAFTITLPPSAANEDLVLSFKKIDSSGNLPTIQANGSEHIDGANTYTGLSAQYDVARLWCDGTQWWIF
ncbi:MAG TPA: hypothetical protein VHY37_03530 [Tepidisphaeraceae bacterium]|jgi:hypothetical protein|nr:hypothetical protein [Tepidisphaeraceae bacterium]